MNAKSPKFMAHDPYRSCKHANTRRLWCLDTWSCRSNPKHRFLLERMLWASRCLQHEASKVVDKLKKPWGAGTIPGNRTFQFVLLTLNSGIFPKSKKTNRRQTQISPATCDCLQASCHVKKAQMSVRLQASWCQWTIQSLGNPRWAISDFKMDQQEAIGSWTIAKHRLKDEKEIIPATKCLEWGILCDPWI